MPGEVLLSYLSYNVSFLGHSFLQRVLELRNKAPKREGGGGRRRKEGEENRAQGWFHNRNPPTIDATAEDLNGLEQGTASSQELLRAAVRNREVLDGFQDMSGLMEY